MQSNQKRPLTVMQKNWKLTSAEGENAEKHMAGVSFRVLLALSPPLEKKDNRQ